MTLYDQRLDIKGISMNKLTIEQEQKLLHDCIYNGRKDLFIREYWLLIYRVVEKTIHFFPILIDKFSDKSEKEMLRNEVFLKLFENDCQKLKKFKKKYNIRLSSWIKILTSRMVIDFLRKEVLRLFETIDDGNGQLSCNDYNKIDEQKLIQLKMSITETFDILTERDSEVFLLFSEGYTAKEISKKITKKMNLKEGNIYKIVERVREKFKGRLCHEN
ncbi:sigma-70 family RNA polymerase sigma factor [Candidatus Magnetomorum sp. HK-1]|nr:sigma-70 family RNA polymerase sigma factor [Candidatus Magnetomorum sp. HK-1]